MKNILPTSQILYWLLILSILSMGIFSPVQGVSAAKINLLQTDNVVFAVIGDYGLASKNEADVANLVKSWNPNFIVTVGDNNYEKGLAETIDQNIGQYYHDYIFRYNGKYGSGSSTNRFFPALGNHDWGNNGIKPFLDYFTLPGNERYYDFVGGSVHFFILDSDPSEPDETSSTGKQARWLKNGLAASTSPFNIVVLHHAPYSSGLHGSNSYMQWPFKVWGASAVLSGHDHIYERLLIGDLPYFVNGLGGDTLYTFGATVPGSQTRFNQDFGAMRMVANSTSLKFQFFTRANTLIDEYTISEGIPTVTSIVRASPNPTNSVTVNYAVNFSESVSGVDASDFVLASTNISGASIVSVNGSGTSYTVSVNTGTGSGTLRLDLIDNDSIININGSALDGIETGNGNFSNGESYSLDKTPPTAISIVRAGPSPSHETSVDFIVTFSEPITGLSAADFTLNTTNIGNAIISSMNGSGTSYVVTVNTGNGNGTIRLDLSDNDNVVDFSGNKLGGDGAGNGSFVNGEIYNIEKSIPNVISIVRANANPTNAFSVDFVVTFSEAVTGVDETDFYPSTANINNASVSAVNGSGNIYFVSVQTGFGDGTVRLDLVDDDSIVNGTGYTLGDSGLGNGNFPNGESYTLDKTAPIVTSIIRSSTNPSTSSSVDFIVSFSEAVISVDGTDFSLNLVNISNASINSVTEANPFYVVNVNTGDGSGTIRLDVAGGITDLVGNQLGNGNYTSGEIYDIEKSAPSVTSIINASPSPSGASSVDFIVTFSESVSGVDTSDFAVSATNIISASVLAVNNFDPFYIVTVNTGVGTGTIRLDLFDNDSILDISGNMLGGGGQGNGNFFNGQSIVVSKAPTNFPAPTLRDPQRNFITNNSNPLFSWAKVRNASAYEITIATDANLSNVIANQVVNGLSFAGSAPLADGIYYWRVRAYGSDFKPGKFSAVNSFTIDTTPPTAPNLINPLNNANVSARLKFIWTKVDEATRYHIEIDNNPDFSSPEWSSLRQDPSYQVITFRSGLYFWHVRAKDMAGNWSNWSATNIINIP